MVRKFLLVAGAVATLGSGDLLAQDTGWYVGAGGGGSKARGAESCSDISDILAPGFSCSSKDTSTGWKVFAGYGFNKFVAAEVGYVDLGKFTITASGNALGVPPPNAVNANGTDKASGFSLDLVGTLPITPEFGVIGRIGAFHWTLDSSAQVFGGGFFNVNQSDKPSGTNVDFGAGVKHDFTRSLGVRAEWQRFKNIGDESTTGKSDIDLLSASLVYRFR